LNKRSNPAELDKSLFAGIIYAKRVDNSATVTNIISLFIAEGKSEAGLPPGARFLLHVDKSGVRNAFLIFL
jgi:hypothetical protein